MGQSDVFTIDSTLSNQIAKLGNSNTEFADYDNDGDLDILISGERNDSAFCFVYRRDNNTYANIEAGLPGLFHSSLSWGDYNNDNYLDIILSGAAIQNNTLVPYTYLFENDKSGSFFETQTELPDVFRGDIQWTDYNNDGHQDVVICGAYEQDESGNYIKSGTYILKNSGTGHFEILNTDIQGLYDCEADWGDYDNDEDMDLLLCGHFKDDSGIGFRFTKLYQNQGNDHFNIVEAGFPDLQHGNIAWGDHDGDGDLDLLINGDPDTPTFLVYIFYNNGDGSFGDSGIEIIGTIHGTLAWGDYDIDGDLDFVLSGLYSQSGQSTINKLYRNAGNGLFTEDQYGGLTGIAWSDMCWGDYDADHDLDLLASGFENKDASSPSSIIFRNESSIANTSPSPPSALSSFTSADTVFLRWDASLDFETPSAGLSYNLRIGSESESNNIVSSQTINTGSRTLPERGNLDHNNSWWISGLEEGRYYWSVQAIDNCYEASQFGEEQTFDIVFTNIESAGRESDKIRIFPNPFSSSTAISFNLNQTAPVKISIFNSGGQMVIKESIQCQIGGDFHFIWDGHSQNGQKLAPGLYNCIIQAESTVFLKKLILIK